LYPTGKIKATVTEILKLKCKKYEIFVAMLTSSVGANAFSQEDDFSESNISARSYLQR